MDDARIVLFIDCPTPQRAPTLDSLDRMGIPFTVAYLRPSDDTRGWGSLSFDHPHVVLPSRPHRQLVAVARLAGNRQTAAVCSFGYHQPSYAAAILIARLRQLPVVLRSDTNARRDEHRPPWLRAIKRMGLRFLIGRRATIWTIGESNSRYWSTLGYKDQVRIPYTAPNAPRGAPDETSSLRSSLGFTDEDFVILYVGRLERSKGVLDLCEAYIRLNPKGSLPRALLVVGDGAVRHEVASIAKRERSVIPVGAVAQAELGPYLALADLVVVPSRAEPWGLVVNEALRNGRRVLASDAVGAADDLINDANGSRFSAGDIEALRIALEREIERGRDVVPPLTEPDVAPLFASEFQRLLASVGSRRRADRNRS